MDLSALNSTLPPGLADAERDMGDKFRAAALSITNLYKSSLSYTKQAYHVGYSACLSDVLSTVQSSIGAGQDASQTLSRLMDWAEAREAAMTAFAAEELDFPENTPAQHPPVSKATLAKQALSRLALQQQTPTSTPPYTHDHTSHRIPVTPSLPPHMESTRTYQPPHILASSPISIPSNTMPRPPAPTFISRRSHAGTSRAHSRSPTRSNHAFNPTLPPNLPTPTAPTSNAVNVPIGSKRPLVQDYEMEDAGGSTGAVVATPSRRASKRRGLGGGREEEREGGTGRGKGVIRVKERAWERSGAGKGMVTDTGMDMDMGRAELEPGLEPE